MDHYLSSARLLLVLVSLVSTSIRPTDLSSEFDLKIPKPANMISDFRPSYKPAVRYRMLRPFHASRPTDRRPELAVLPSPHFGMHRPSVALERMTNGRLTLASVAAAVAGL
jgi:hypothetical protein